MGDGGGARDRHLSCPFCATYEVSRMYVASLDLDACECLSCGARWDETRRDGAVRERSSATSVVVPRRR